VDPIVEAPAKTVDQPLDIPAAESAEPTLRFALAIGVEDVRGDADEDTPVPTGDRRRPGEAFDQRLPFIHPAVPVGVGQATDAAGQVFRAFAVTAHFDDDQPPAGIEAEGDRIDHQRFGGHQFQAIPCGDFECCWGLGRGGRLDRFEFRIGRLRRGGDRRIGCRQRSRSDEHAERQQPDSKTPKTQCAAKQAAGHGRRLCKGGTRRQQTAGRVKKAEDMWFSSSEAVRAAASQRRARGTPA
jgi:hypothetical protein